MLILIREDAAVAAEEVATITHTIERITVKLKDGTTYAVGADYGKSIFTTYDRLIKLVNDALRGE